MVYKSSFAEIAQLVEHNLAKVRVASSSLVFRSEKKESTYIMCSLSFFVLSFIFIVERADIGTYICFCSLSQEGVRSCL